MFGGQFDSVWGCNEGECGLFEVDGTEEFGLGICG